MITLKACRGAGLPLAQAQDVAKAVSCQGTADVFAELIELLNAPLPSKMDVSANVVRNAHVLRDLPGLADAVLAGAGSFVLHGATSVAIAKSIAGQAGVSCTECPEGLRLEGDGSQHSAVATRVNISDEHWHSLERLAAKILVPETEETRLSGAGAGLNDND